MRVDLYRRLALLEARQGNAARRMHMIMATDEDDRQRQVAALVAGGCWPMGRLCVPDGPTATARFRVI
jgi:hypothetical protein